MSIGLEHNGGPYWSGTNREDGVWNGSDKSHAQSTWRTAYHDLIVEHGRYADRIDALSRKPGSAYELIRVSGSIQEFPMPDFIVADLRHVLIAGYQRDGTIENHLVIESPEVAEALIGWFDACVSRFRESRAPKSVG